MKSLPKLGTRVRYDRKATKYGGPARTITGTVVDHYPGYVWKDDETGERHYRPPHAAVKVDSIPDWWPYTGSDRFAPSIDELSFA